MNQVEIIISGITKENRIDKYNSLVSAVKHIEAGHIKEIKQEIKKSGAEEKDYRDISITLPYPLEKSNKRTRQALRSTSFALDIPAKHPKGEIFLFASQEDLTDKWAKELFKLVKDTYSYILLYFGLPSANVIQKSKNLIHMGRILYYPDTGEPIKKRDWDLFVSNLEKFLNRRTKNFGEKIVLDAGSLGKILNRMLKYNTLDAIKNRRLNDIKFKNKTFDWISESTKNMKSVLGETLSRGEQSRIEVMAQSAGAKITRITDSMKNDVKQVLIDGVRQRKSKSEVSQELFRKMVGHNRDFQRIADTEIQNAVNNAYVKEESYMAEEGEKVYFQRIEVIDDNTCEFCKQMNGKIVLWSKSPLASDKIKDEHTDTAIWDGKDWAGEKNFIATGVFHPYCRGAWVRWSPHDKVLDALMADKSGKRTEWNKIIKEARKEYEESNNKEPTESTKEYIQIIDEKLNKSHKYISRWKKNNRWEYKYPGNQPKATSRGKSKTNIAKKTKLITDVEPLKNLSLEGIKIELDKLKEISARGELRCSALGNSNVEIIKITEDHLFFTKKEKRTKEAAEHKAKFLPFVPQILKTGKISEKSYSRNRNITYGIIGQVGYYDEKKQKNTTRAIELSITYDSKRRKYLLSFSDYDIKKSLLYSRDFNALSLRGGEPASSD